MNIRHRSLGDLQPLFITEEAKRMRWFLLPSEAQLQIIGQPVVRATPVFEPRKYPCLADEGQRMAMDCCRAEGEVSNANRGLQLFNFYMTVCDIGKLLMP